jgi:hypothetical protein
MLFGSKSCPISCSPNGISKGACDTVQGVCNCYYPFTGADCSLYACDDPFCSGHGTCDSSVGECVCDTGNYLLIILDYTGDSCQNKKCQNNCSGL